MDVSVLRESVNRKCSKLDAFQLIIISGATSAILFSLVRFVEGGPISWRLGLAERCRRKFFKLLWKLPSPLKKKKDQQFATAIGGVKKEFAAVEGEESYPKLPQRGMTSSQLMEIMVRRRDQMQRAPKWEDARVSGTVYHGGEEITNLVVDAFRTFCWANPLHPQTFPAVRKMEAEVVAMTVAMFGGSPSCCGAMTAGGTESILLACRAYRQWGYDTRGIEKPEIVVPRSVHAAFDKAGDYFGIRIVHIDDKENGIMDINAMSRAINKNTVALVGSAPSFPYGTIDPIAEIAALALQHKIGCHVDSCLGGFVVPFCKKAGFEDVPEVGFRVPGVTSISCDTHKYGFGPKGTSVIMYRTPELRKYQYFSYTDWPGGIYATPTIAGSRPGSLIAGTWAVMMHMGEEGYIKAAKAIVSTSRSIAERLSAIPGLQVIGPSPHRVTCVVAIRSTELDIFAIGEELKKRKWELNALLFPPALHLCVTHVHTREDVANALVADVEEIASALMKLPREERACSGSLKMYGSSQTIPDRSLVQDLTYSYFDSYYASAQSS